MNLFSPPEMVANYSAVSIKKSRMTYPCMLIMSIIAGMIIAFCGAATNTVTIGIENAGTVRLICGLVFPFGLGMVVLSGAELFTGNCLMSIGVLDKKIRIPGLLRNWICVYIGNFIGSLIVAFAVAGFGQLSIGGGQLAVLSIKMTAAKCSIPFANCFVQGILCNILVCFAVLFSLSAKDVPGRILGAYTPVALFVMMGVNHSIADMYFGTVGIFAKGNPQYAQLIEEAALDLSNVTWGNYFMGNMIPVTLGNIVGGVLVGFAMWYCHGIKTEKSM